MGTEALLLQRPCYNEHMGGLSLPGTIVTTKNCQAYIRLDMDGEKGESCYGYPWTPETGNLMYCMPKPGTRAMLYLDSHCEGYARVVCSPRTNGYGNPGSQSPWNRADRSGNHCAGCTCNFPEGKTAGTGIAGFPECRTVSSCHCVKGKPARSMCCAGIWWKCCQCNSTV